MVVGGTRDLHGPGGDRICSRCPHLAGDCTHHVVSRSKRAADPGDAQLGPGSRRLPLNARIATVCRGDHLPDVCCAIRVAIENLKETIDAAVVPLFRTPGVHRFNAADDRDPLPSCQ
ncbi:hypothetical protein XAP412_840019 [Xanthomonas phaseoli pv. phaseoli]|uniref:Uncharacterized protein n=1 Tax=Xanthomonas campestris pv. phaseoli TaxID=317013 RepID=A0AB38E636_XANCH|nr:hypothetical protein XAP6984_870019 [Xanthomonas phaseoli pv. phaseoli]SON90928.1 hypothetical protein XAP412_840019 [Xanthomonas phaseoli pv. phaseoli]SON92723.1 hypothetical protein XAP7430_850019 [Xanthomonas phaseoli pv. phaseoli]SOO29674.1 hypothetical protein XAP6164_3530016 [Xanthomonas phaseoli pv. phaseoli]